MPLSPADQAKIDELKAMTLAGEGVRVCELVAVFWPQPTGTVYYSSIQADEVYPTLTVSPVEARLAYADDALVREVIHEEGISDDQIDLDFWDADGVISDLAHTHGEGVRVEVFYYYSDVDLFLSMWWGHLLVPDSADQERFKTQAEQGFRSAQLPLPRRAFFTGCQAVWAGYLQTQAEIDEGDCPSNAHLTEEQRGGAPLVGNLDPDTGLPYTSCPRNTREVCTARIGDSLSFLAFDSTVESIVNNQTKGGPLLATSRGNENNLKRPLRVVAGKRRVRDLDLLAFTPQLNSNNSEDGFVRTLFAISEGRNKSVTRCQVNDEIFPPDQIQVRLGEKRQAPTGFSPNVGNYSGTSLFFGVYGQVDPEQYSDPETLSGQCLVEGHDEVRVYSDPDDPTAFTEQYTTDRAWWLAHQLRHKRWGLGTDVARLELADLIFLSTWGRQVVTFTNEEGRIFAGVRTDFNAELIDRTAQQQINDLCLAGRFGLPFPQYGKLRVVPLRKLTEEELDAAPVFTDYGDARNIVVEDETEKSSVTRSQMSDKELPNRVVLTFDDAARGHIQRPLTFEDVPQQLKAGRSFGDTSRRVVEKKYTALGVTSFDAAARLGHYLRDLGPFDDGGIVNNLRVTFKTWHALTLDLHKYQVIKVLSHQLERYGFEYFRVRHLRYLPDLKVEISAQAYADTYAGDEEVAVCAPGDPYDVEWTEIDGFDLEEDNGLTKDEAGEATAIGSRTYDPLRCTYATWTVEDSDHCRSWWIVFEDEDGGNQYGWFFNLFVGVAPVAARVEDGVPNAGNSFFGISLPAIFRLYLNQGDVELQRYLASAFSTIYTFPVPTDRRYRLKVYATAVTSAIPPVTVEDSEGPNLAGSVTADAGADVTAALGEQVLLDGSGSTATDTEIASYDWEFVSGPVGVSILGTGPTRLVRPTSVGTYVFRLTVYGERGARDSDTMTLTVTDLAYLYEGDGEQLYEGEFVALYELGEEV